MSTLYQNAFPVTGDLDQRHLLSLEGLQIIMKMIATGCTRMEVKSPPFNRNGPTLPTKLLNSVVQSDTHPDVLKEIKKIKELVVGSIATFNKNPKEGLKAFQGMFFFFKNLSNFFEKKNKENQLLSSPLQPKEVAELFLNTPGLDKTKLGDLLGEKSEFSEQVLREYIVGFVNEFHSDVEYMSLTTTVRAFLESFR